MQIDGSPFAWLEARGPELMLLGAVDDATTEILALHFRPAEDVHGYTTLFQRLFTRHGLPLALYGDRLNLLVRNDPHWSLAEQLAGTQHPTHLGLMLQDLGIGYIAAPSPPAKGRIERLGATRQDRLVSELRLRRLASVTAAEAFLPAFIADFNRRFGKPPAAPAAVWRRPSHDLALILSCRYRRVVARDNRPPRPALAAAPGPPRLGPPPRGGARTPRRHARRPPRRRRAGHATAARSRLHPQTPPRAQPRASPYGACAVAPSPGAAAPPPHVAHAHRAPSAGVPSVAS